MKHTAAPKTEPVAGAKPAEPPLPVASLLAELHARYQGLSDGKLADYIPELAKADPALFGIAAATTDGFVYGVGDAGHPFSIQSISKPIVYGLAMQERGRDYVLSRIGIEPSGDAFNSITFDEKHNRPFNPMVNAGAIAATSLIQGASKAERFGKILGIFERFAGRKLAVDEAVHVSEAATGHRNRAIAYLELNAGMIEGDVEEHLDLYFRQCAILVTARDLAVMAATLANGGINPVTGARALDTAVVRDMLSVMNTCGMYDYAGGWQFTTGLPAKSGVGGGILAVLPGRLGIGTFSPPLDPVGNSERGVRVCQDLSAACGLHLLDHRPTNRTAVRRVYRGDAMRSKRIRRNAHNRALDSLGSVIMVYELQGELLFAEAENMTRRVLQDAASGHYFALDFERVAYADRAALDLIRRLAVALRQAGKELVITGFAPTQESDSSLLPACEPNIDTALEKLEEKVLAAAGYPAGAAETFAPAEIDILADLAKPQLEKFAKLLSARRFHTGERIIRRGDPADSLFFIMRGFVNVLVPIKSGEESHRVSTIEAGMVFGELALFSGGPRTADVEAGTDTEVLVLEKAAFDKFAEGEPEIHRALLSAVGRSLADRLRRANEEIRVLAQ